MAVNNKLTYAIKDRVVQTKLGSSHSKCGIHLE